MKFLLIGKHRLNAGPCNVNKSLIASSDDDMLYIKSENRLFMLIEIFLKAMRADVIVMSGMCHKIIYYLLKPLKKRMVYILHGYLAYEKVINNLQTSSNILAGEELFLKNADLILCVSEWHSEWFKEKRPEYAYKVDFLNNGVNIARRETIEQEPNSIAVSGGNRRIKNNADVCIAVKKIIESGEDCKLYVFGRIYKNNDDIVQYPFVEYVGHLNKKEYYAKLDKISLFVLNSEVEPFGLVFADAINCNCSILASKNVGSLSLVEVQEEDVIYNPHDIDELSAKIRYALHHSNAERLYRTVDIEKVSEKKAYEKLKRFCAGILDAEC